MTRVVDFFPPTHILLNKTSLIYFVTAQHPLGMLLGSRKELSAARLSAPQIALKPLTRGRQAKPAGRG